MENIKYLLSLILFVYGNNIFSQSIVGKWEGAVPFNGSELNFIFNIEQDDSIYTSTISIPKQGLNNFKAKKALVKGSFLSIRIPEFKMEYEGNVKSDSLISGYIIQNNNKTVLDLKKDVYQDNIGNSTPELIGEHNYIVDNVTFKTSSGYWLRGLFSYPKTNRFPVVVLVNGSGPQNRDGEMYGHKPNYIIADYLNKNGVGVLRFDERGVGCSEGDYQETTLETSSEDVANSIKYLRDNYGDSIQNIGIIGHSFGGVIASKVASEQKNIDYIILLASPGVDGDKLMLRQKADVEKMLGINEELIMQGQRLMTDVYNIITSSDIVGEKLIDSLNNFLTTEYYDLLSEKERHNIIESLSSLEVLSLLRTKPSRYLENVNSNILAIAGSKDIQVNPLKNLAAIKNCANEYEGRKVDTLLLEGLNHFLQESETGSILEYSTIKETISPKVLRAILTWIRENNCF